MRKATKLFSGANFVGLAMGELAMATRGRKRKPDVRRQPDGRTHPDTRDDPRSTVTMRRMRMVMHDTVTHPLFGFPLGQLALLKEITADEFDAGCSWADVTWRHAQMIGLMLPKCKAIDWQGSQGRSLAQEPDEERIMQLRQRKNEADRRINSAGIGAMKEMERVVLCDEVPGNAALLKRALQILVDK
jgi:hypothetical protein